MAYWFFYEDGKKIGPFDSANLKRLAATGRIAPDTIVETEQGKQAKAENVQGLFKKAPVVAAAPAAPPPIAPPAPPVVPPVQPVADTYAVAAPEVSRPSAPQVAVPHKSTQPVQPSVPADAAGKNSKDGKEIWEYEGHPDWLIGQPFYLLWLLLMFLFIVVLTFAYFFCLFSDSNELERSIIGMCDIGLIIFLPISIFIRRLMTRLTTLSITNKRIILIQYRYLFLLRDESEVRHKDIRSIAIHQNILQRLFSSGDIAVATASSGISEIRAKGFREVEKIKRIAQKYQSMD